VRYIRSQLSEVHLKSGVEFVPNQKRARRLDSLFSLGLNIRVYLEELRNSTEDMWACTIEHR
jgi:hypothetical protein